MTQMTSERTRLAIVCGVALALAACTTRPGGDTDAGQDAAIVIQTDAASACDNGVRNGDESHVDCGGSCPRCPAASPCRTPADCRSNVCADGFCASTSCDDDLRNGEETAVDCGGSVCAPCGIGRACVVRSDCETLNCDDGVCGGFPRCDDGVANGDETGLDCGGSCPGCGDGDLCLVDEDCAGGYCAGTCAEPSCFDGRADPSETSPDRPIRPEATNR